MNSRPVNLTLYPSIQSAVEVIEVGWSWHAAHTLTLAYVVKANIRELRIPALRPPRRMDRLWEHTCFEAFVQVSDRSAYYELNFSPSSEWAAYAFRGYRDGAPIEGEDLVSEIIFRFDEDRIELTAMVRLLRLPLVRPGTNLRLGLSAVIEEQDGTLSYWALKHPAENPDFHHPDSFTLELALPT